MYGHAQPGELRPPGTFVPPSNPGTHANTRRRVLAVEQRPTPTPVVPRFCLTATNTDVVSGELSTGRWLPWRGAVDLEYVTIDLRWVDAPTTVTVRRSGVEALVASLDEDGTIRQGCDERWTLADYLDVSVSGEVGRIVVQMWFRGEGGGGLVFSPDPGGGST